MLLALVATVLVTADVDPVADVTAFVAPVDALPPLPAAESPQAHDKTIVDASASGKLEDLTSGAK